MHAVVRAGVVVGDIRLGIACEVVFDDQNVLDDWFFFFMPTVTSMDT